MTIPNSNISTKITNFILEGDYKSLEDEINIFDLNISYYVEDKLAIWRGQIFVFTIQAKFEEGLVLAKVLEEES